MAEDHDADPEPQPRVFERSDVIEAVRYVAGSVKAPAVGQLLASAGCCDPSPANGKKSRVRAAIDATQQRDGHAGAVVRLIENVRAALDAEDRRAAALRAAYSASGATITRAKVRARDGFSFEIGVTRDPEDLCIAVTVHPDLAGTPIRLDLEQARDFYKEFIEVGKEVAERRASPWQPRSRR